MSFFTSIKYFNIIEKIQYTLIIILIFSLPYNIIAPRFTLLLSVLIFVSAFIYPKRSLQSLLQHKVILSLFGFILLTYLSAIWTPAKDIFGGNFKINIYAYLNYFFLIPGIYLAQLNKKKLQYLIISVIFSPIIYLIIYYTNFFGLTQIYSYHYWTNDPTTYYTHTLYVDLFANIFLLFSSIFLYIKLLVSIKNKNYKYFIILTFLFLSFSASLFIVDLTSSRLMNLAYFSSILFISLYILSTKQKVIFILIFIFMMGLIFSKPNTFTQGIHQATLALEHKHNKGSWSVRVKLANYGLKMWKENPILGRGITDVIDYIKATKAQKPEYFETDVIHFHNQHILILVQVGIIGYLLFSLFSFNYYKLPIKNQEFNLYNKVTILIYFILMCGEHYLQMVHTSTLFALFSAIYISYYQEENEIKEN